MNDDDDDDKLRNHDEKEHKRHDLAIEKLQITTDELDKNRMKWIDFINKRLQEKNEARVYINNVYGAMFEYYRADFYHLSEKKGELFFVTVSTSLTTYANYKYLKGA